LQTNNIQPKTTDLYDLGTGLKRWNKVIAKTVVAETIEGILLGNISGNANTATSLKDVTTFQITGDVVSPVIQFDGQVGSYTKIFNTTLTSDIISNKSELFPKVSRKQDFVLTYRASAATSTSSGLFKQTRDTFVGDLGIPIGGIIPYAGANAPYGFLFCDGSEIERTKFSTLYDVIGTTYNGLAALIGVNTFRLPDLRGRFALGKDNMDNAGTVPIITGGFVDAGGGTTGRVPDVKAVTLGGDAGQSSTTLTLANLPEHSHTLSSGSQDYSAISVSTTIDPAATTGLGPTAPGQAQYLKDSGGIKKPLLGTITGTISGTTLTVATVSFGIVAPGATLSGVGITPGTTIVSGSGSTWTISNSHTISVAIPMNLSGVTSIGIMNPFLTINYIIRSGPPLF